MARTIWNAVYEQMGGKYGEDSPNNEAAWNAAWEAYNNANPATRDDEWSGSYGKVYDNANDKIAENSGLDLKTQSGKWRIEADKLHKDKDQGWFNTDDDTSYRYQDGKLYDGENLENEVTDQGVLDMFNKAMNDSKAAFKGSPSEHQNMSNYDYYSRQGINYEDALNGFGDTNKAVGEDEKHLYNTFGDTGIKQYHDKGMNDFKLRYSPDVDPYTKQDVIDYANMVKGNDLKGWQNEYSKINNTMDAGDSRLAPEVYAKREMLDNPKILSDELAKGNYAALADLSDGDIQALDDLAGKMSGWGFGYFNDNDPARMVNESNLYDTIRTDDFKDRFKKLNEIQDKYRDKRGEDGNLSKEDEENLQKEMDENNVSNEFGDWASAIFAAKNNLRNAALLDAIGKGNKEYTSNNNIKDIVANSLQGSRNINDDIDGSINWEKPKDNDNDYEYEDIDVNTSLPYDSSFLNIKDIPNFYNDLEKNNLYTSNYKKAFNVDDSSNHPYMFGNTFNKNAIQNTLARIGMKLKGSGF